MSFINYKSEVKFEDAVLSENLLKFSFLCKSNRGNKLTLNSSFELEYKNGNFYLDEEVIVDIFLSVLLPHIAYRWPESIVKCKVNQSQIEHWKNYLVKLNLKNNIIFENYNTKINLKNIHKYFENKFEKKPSLFFGGGIESMSALSIMRKDFPNLISISGDKWMNNNSSVKSFNIKKGIENDFVREYNLSLFDVYNNIRDLFHEKESYVNKYVTGSFMYYASLPVLLKIQSPYVFFAFEKEQNNSKISDLSLNSFTLSHVVRSKYPALIVIMNSYRKVELLKLIYDQSRGFLKYTYSCLKNTENKWCCCCEKCQRVHYYCSLLNIDPCLLGLPKNMKYENWKGYKSKIFWKSSKKHMKLKFKYQMNLRLIDLIDIFDNVIFRNFWKFIHIRKRKYYRIHTYIKYFKKKS